MAMIFEFNLLPFGYHNDKIQFASMNIESFHDKHLYTITFKNKGIERKIQGNITKTNSGHRNFLHLLKNILDDLQTNDIWGQLGEDYVEVYDDILKMFPDNELIKRHIDKKKASI